MPGELEVNTALLCFFQMIGLVIQEYRIIASWSESHQFLQSGALLIRPVVAAYNKKAVSARQRNQSMAVNQQMYTCLPIESLGLWFTAQIFMVAQTGIDGAAIFWSASARMLPSMMSPATRISSGCSAFTLSTHFRNSSARL